MWAIGGSDWIQKRSGEVGVEPAAQEPVLRRRCFCNQFQLGKESQGSMTNVGLRVDAFLRGAYYFSFAMPHFSLGATARLVGVE